MDIESLTELFWEQRNSGNAESPESFASRYPEYKEELLAVLSVLVKLEELKHSESPVAALPMTPPDRLGDFCLHEKIGSGGMGSVYRATQLSLKRDVALKVLYPALALDEKARQRFVNESQIIAKLHHPNIVNVYGAGYESGWCFYVMELIDGKALNCNTFSGDRTHLRKIIEAAFQSASALAYAHSEHILHRDFKLSNLIMDGSGNIHLSDFGISSILQDAAAAEVTRTQEGTLRYMAPEIFLTGSYSFSSDQYSFGVSMYELITGSDCYSGLSPGQIVHKICDGRFPELPGSYSDLAVVINKCTAYSAKDRYSSMSEVRDELSRILNHEPIHASRISFFRRVMLWAYRRPASAVLLSVSCLLFFAFVAALFTGYHRTSQILRQEIIQRTQAERNARVANEILKKIFDMATTGDLNSSSTLSPSPAMLSLLHDLAPYYEVMQSDQTSVPDDFMTDLDFRMGTIAMQAGEYDLARRMFSLASAGSSADPRKHAESMNQEALAALYSGDPSSARSIWLHLATLYENSAELDCRLFAAEALLNLSGMGLEAGEVRHFRPVASGIKSYLIRANRILTECRERAPENPDIRFLAACFSAAFPGWQEKFTPGEDPFSILLNLAAEYPHEWRYQLEFIHLVLNTPFRRNETVIEQQNVRTAISFAERLLVLMPFNEKLIADTLALHQRNSFRKKGGKSRFEIYQEQWHLIGFLKPIAIHPQTSDASRKLMLNFLFAQLRNTASGERAEDLNILLRTLIQDILSVYNGADKELFQSELARLP